MNQSSAVLELTEQLIRCQSVTPDDAGCQAMIAKRLAAIGFRITQMPFGEVTNLWATYGSDKPALMFAGHTDVVPTGPLSDWQSPPFEPTLRDGYLFGRGAADMKASLAAMVIAAERLLASQKKLPRGLGFLITSDEEGPAHNGTVKVIQTLAKQNQVPGYCIVGEPSSTNQLGDVVRIGRRGSLNGHLVLQGVQGHVAYPTQADNPIHRVLGFLQDLTDEIWDTGNQHYPATSLQISNIHGGTGATNVIPGTVSVDLNFRFNTEQSSVGLQNRVAKLIEQQQGARQFERFDLQWQLSGEPFLTKAGRLTAAVQQTIKRVTGLEPELSTSGGTSDGRFIAPFGCEVIEVGPCNDTIHKIDESVAVHDLEPLSAIYQGIAETLLVR